MIWSRLLAIVLVVGAAAWIGSGVLGEAERKTAPPPHSVEAKPLFKVSVRPVASELHARAITLSGRTEAERRATAVARTSGVIVDLKVRRGSQVKAGDVIAVLSDEAREAQVIQAKARLEQRRIELRGRLRLIESGTYPAINRPQLEAEMKGAEAAYAQAEAEWKKGDVVAPMGGVVDNVPVEVGQALQSFMSGTTIAEIVALDPMLAVVEVAERQLSGVKVGETAEVRLVTGETVTGKVRFVSAKASAQTRTYRVEIRLDNPQGAIPDGLTCEVVLKLAPVKASRIPRSALTFSGEGRLGVRIVGDDGKVAFVPVAIVEDSPREIWAAGLGASAKVIVQGQDFVKEGEAVEAVQAAALASSS